MASCFFIGHREIYADIRPQLVQAITQHITQYGVTEFVVGNYGSFDRMAAGAVIAAKQQFPEITLSMLIPYHPAERPVALPPGFDNTFYPPGMERIPRKLAIVGANQYMVNHVDYLIAYVRHPASNARNLVEYARKLEERHLLEITML